jgi:dGTPase
MNIRLALEEKERQFLSAKAKLSSESAGRLKPEPPCDLRPAFQRDRDRIIHSKAFRRLKHKTQVFLALKGDHYRTRLTHTLEVAQIARTLAKALGLNEELTEAIALGHDLGHPPFGHAGEAVLNQLLPGGFHHSQQSLRVVDSLEKGGKGLNLTQEVREGIIKHSKGRGPLMAKKQELLPSTLEGQAVRLADLMAYVNHDSDDAIRAEIVKETDLPVRVVRVLGASASERIDKMVRDTITETLANDLERLVVSEEVCGAIEELREFLFEKVYDSPPLRTDFKKSSKILEELYQYFLDRPEQFEKEADWQFSRKELIPAVADFLAGMTDQFAINLYGRIFLPRPWGVY